MSADTYFGLVMTLALPGALIFLVVYGLTAPWWKSFLGRALFTKSFGVSLTILFSALLFTFGPDYVGRDTLRIVGATVIFFGVWGQAIAITSAKARQLRIVLRLQGRSKRLRALRRLR